MESMKKDGDSGDLAVGEKKESWETVYFAYKARGELPKSRPAMGIIPALQRCSRKVRSSGLALTT